MSSQISPTSLIYLDLRYFVFVTLFDNCFNIFPLEMKMWTYKNQPKYENRSFKKPLQLNKDFPCGCGRQFSHEKNLRYHQKWECGRALKCVICESEFASRSRLVSHQRVCAMEQQYHGSDINFYN